MQEVNDAYQAGDLKRLRDILASEKMSPERVKGDDIGRRCEDNPKDCSN